MNSKKGISLIVLMIIIVLIIILVSAVAINVSQNNPVQEAKEASKYQSFANFKEELDMYISNQESKTFGEFEKENFSVKADDKLIEEVLPSIKKSEFKGKISITNGKLDISSFTDKKEIDLIVKVVGKENLYTK